MDRECCDIVKIDVEHPDISVLRSIADVVCKGGMIVYPTDTIYGIGVDAFNEEAIDRVFELKHREKGKPILIIADSIEMVKSVVSYVPEVGYKLINRFWPGPLTILFPALEHISKKLTGNSGKIGIRIPNNRFCLELVKTCGVPITSTSANISGRENPASVQQILDSIGDKVDLIVDGGVLKSDLPSTVVDITSDQAVVVRQGVISEEEIKRACGS
jgi:L-threonylcarbamoyladenylate synthase